MVIKYYILGIFHKLTIYGTFCVQTVHKPKIKIIIMLLCIFHVHVHVYCQEYIILQESIKPPYYRSNNCSENNVTCT